MSMTMTSPAENITAALTGDRPSRALGSVVLKYRGEGMSASALASVLTEVRERLPLSEAVDEDVMNMLDILHGTGPSEVLEKYGVPAPRRIPA